jgi:flagellar FliJ protein
MKKFRFSLGTVLKVREQKERLAQQEVQAVESQLKMIRDKVEELKQEGEALYQSLPGQVGRALSAADLRGQFDYLQYLNQLIAYQEDEAMRVNNILAGKRHELMEAAKERKAIEQLRDRRFEEWQAETRLEEQNFLDELAVLRHRALD